MTESIPNESIPQPQNRSTGALVVFLVLILPMPLCLLVYHFVVWTMEQSAIISISAKQFAWAGPLGLAAQAVVMTGLTALSGASQKTSVSNLYMRVCSSRR